MVSQSSSVGYTIMGKTADLTVVQKTTIDTLHKEGKTQKVIAKEAGCSQSSVSKHIQGSRVRPNFSRVRLKKIWGRTCATSRSRKKKSLRDSESLSAVLQQTR